MYPAGIRLEEKKSMDGDRSVGDGSKSQLSYRSTPSSRSSVLERAREYSRRIDEKNLLQQTQQQQRRRAKSLDRPDTTGSEVGSMAGNSSHDGSSRHSSTPRSRSAGRMPQTSRMSTRERAMASVRKDSEPAGHHAAPQPATHHSRRAGGPSTDATQPLTPSSAHYSHPTQGTRPSPQGQHHHAVVVSPSARSPPGEGTPSSHHHHHNSNNRSNHHAAAASHHHHQPHSLQPSASAQSRRSSAEGGNVSHQQTKPSPSRSQKSMSQREEPPEAIVTPELLVDALSGHEDGLLAIAEKLMEHYDAGYDAMGEAIIDAFADVQKLFQHVVEAAHMEGAAFEASRREQEMAELRRQAAAGELLLEGADVSAILPDGSLPDISMSPAAPQRHDEFIDQDVKDVLTEAIRKGTALREANKHKECYQLYERACQDASSLLPVDSDHRGRLQLSIARAESMSPDRACAILRYSMDDVLRSGLRAGRTPLPDTTKRADLVLTRPKNYPSTTHHGSALSGQATSVVQSSDEALASLQEEMKEILGAPVYHDTPLQHVARRFWTALTETQKAQQKNEEKLEQNLGKLKGEYLLARAEWEEKLNQSNEMLESYKEKYERLKEHSRAEHYMDQARSFTSRSHDRGGNEEDNDFSMYGGGSMKSSQTRSGSVASLGSGLAQHAKTLVTSMTNLNCNALNDRSGSVVDDDMAVDLDMVEASRSSRLRSAAGRSPYASADRSRSKSSHASNNSKSFREYSRSPQRVDV